MSISVTSSETHVIKIIKNNLYSPKNVLQEVHIESLQHSPCAITKRQDRISAYYK